MSTSHSSPAGGRLPVAVVIGGSIAGTLAAAAIAPHFDQVLVLDKDDLPDAAVPRRGVPQGAHFHALLAAGRKAMDELLPGFSEAAFAMGAAKLDATQDVMRLDRVGWSPRFPSTLEFLMATRPLIEKALRDRATEISNVRYMPGTGVARLLATDGTVDAVLTEDNQEIAADLVIDASGRRSKAPSWLEQLGFPKPVESTVNAHWGYSSTLLRIPEDWDRDFKALAVTPFGQGAATPEAATRALAMWVVEGDRRWILTAQGSAGDHPPRTEEALREFISSIGVPDVDKALSQVEFDGSIALWRDTTSRMRDFAASGDRPENFIAMGDAWMAFNPVYGQGMTAAALQARNLQDEMREHLRSTPGTLRGLAARFYATSDPIIKYCWNSSNTLDYRIPGVEVKVDGVVKEPAISTADFSDRLAAYMAQDEDRYVRYRETTQLLRSPEWLQSDEVVNAVKENWDELGRAVVPR